MATTRDENKARLDRALKLIEKATELHAQTFDCLTEAKKILAGDVALGDLLKRGIEIWCEVWEANTGVKFQWAGTEAARNAAAMKRLVKEIPLDDLRRRMQAYCQDQDAYYRTKRWPFALFAANVNRYAPEPDEELTLASAPADCKHLPPCRSDEACTTRKRHELKGLSL